MAPSTLPFSPPSGHSHKGSVIDCPMFRLLPPPLQEESKDKTHLLQYLHALPVEEVGIPEYFPQLERKMGDMKNPNQPDLPHQGRALYPCLPGHIGYSGLLHSH